MKEYVLSYYPKFKCISSECKNSCCVGWDLYIDDTTLSHYKNDNSNFAKTLKEGINFKKSKFKASKSGKCAFLNENGLCDIIINLGENSLCQICRDHPRFRCYYEGNVEMGLGFCCEEATRIILSFKDKIEPVLVKDDETTTLNFIQEQVLKFRTQALATVQDRTKSVNERLLNLLSLCKVDGAKIDFKKIIKEFSSLERLNKTWGKRLKTLKNRPIALDLDENLSLEFEQFLTNSFYRHLAQAEDTLWARAIALSFIFAWWTICAIYENEKISGNEFKILCDIVRDFSSEVEYSENNLKKLFSFSNKFIKL